jgi:hypothetical protein
VTGPGISCAHHPFEVQSRGETEIEVTLRGGTPRWLQVVDASDGGKPARVRCTVQDARGKTVFEQTLTLREGRDQVPAWFLPGVYRARAATESGLAGETAFQVAPGEGAEATVTIRMK